MSARIIFRQDYTEPPMQPAPALARLATVAVTPTPGTSTWNTVCRSGVVIGYVTSRMHGQYWRTPTHEDWIPAFGTSNRADPPHAHALLELLDYMDCAAATSPVPCQARPQ